MRKMYKTVICKSGFSMSVQASETNYCEPRDNIGPYDSVEVGFPSTHESMLMPWCEDPENPTETVYGYVPSKIIWDVILKQGGYESGELPPLVVGPSWQGLESKR